MSPETEHTLDDKLPAIQVEVMGEIQGGFRLKVSFPALGVYIAGWPVRQTDRDDSGWYVQPPAHRAGRVWKKNVEFDQKKPLWLEIKVACIQAIEEYQGLGNAPTLTSEELVEPTDEELADDNLFQKNLSDCLDSAMKNLEVEKPQAAIPWMNDED